MTPALRSAAGAAALLLVVLASGCGGGDTDEQNAYVEKVNRVQTQFSSAYRRVAGQITSTSSSAEDRKTLALLQKTITDGAADLRAVKPPSDVKKLHSELVAVLDGYGDQLDASSAAVVSRDPARAARAAAALAADTADTSTDFSKTITEINQKLRE